MIDAGDAKQTNKPIWYEFGSLFVKLSLFLAVFSFSLTAVPRVTLACCTGCPDVGAAVAYVAQSHVDLINNTWQEWDDDTDAYENWLIDTFLNKEVAVASALMVTQMSAIAMQYTQIIGAFLDAQTQLETQRVLRHLQYEAHRDYIPSETFCYFGTNVRSLGGSEEKGRLNALILSSMSLDRQMGNVHMAGSIDFGDDRKSRWHQFVHTYCDPLDNNFQDEVGNAALVMTLVSPLNLAAGTMSRTGLVLACDHNGSGSGNDIGADDEHRFNRDINYTRLIEKPRTLEIDLSDDTMDSSIDPVDMFYVGPINQPGDEEDIIAMSKNLYGHNILSRRLTKVPLSRYDARRLYLALRGVAAKRNVAQASYNAIVALKSAGTAHEMENGFVPVIVPPFSATVLETKQSRRFLAAVIDQLLPKDPALSGSNIFSLIGYSPSYFSQLEILAKRIYQNPSFYADLYESPTNVARKKVAMKAIELMVDRAIYESQVRREMSISVLLSSKLRALHRDANKALSGAVGQED
ncbi:MAG: hypothetical protein KAJ29_00060 [Alphaproteobacteria bacterium]|nr:hypothetical protein [Alphaproteobacteria bacterium]